MKRILEITTKSLEFLIAAMLAIMVIMVFGNVVLRYGFNSGIVVSEEASRMLFIWVTFIGSIIAMRENAHLGSDFVLRAFGPKVRRACLIVSRLIMLYICWLIAAGTLSQTEINLSVAAPITGLSMGWWFYSSGIVFSVASALIILGDLYGLVANPDKTVKHLLADTGEQA